MNEQDFAAWRRLAIMRAVRVTCVLAVFVVALSGFYAEVAATAFVARLLYAEGFAAGLMHVVGFGAYVGAVAMSIYELTSDA